MSLDLIMGYTGLISFGQAAYFGFGGYAVGLLMTTFHIHSFWILLPAGMAVTAIAAMVIGYFCLRVNGVYFLLVTMAFGQLLSAVAVKWTSLSGGTDGLPGIEYPKFGFKVHWTDLKFYYFVFIVFVVSYIVLHRVANSSFGRSLVGIRENESRMRSLGFNTWAIKYVAVIISAAFAAVAGALYAWDYGSMFPHNFALEMSALPMLMVIMGGGATLWGPCLGAFVIVLAQQYAAIYFFDRWPLVLGVLFVLCVMFLPGGFTPYLTKLWDRMGINRPKAVSAAERPDIGGSEVEA
jgi:branched-chain amino acid transport system permease protein